MFVALYTPAMRKKEFLIDLFVGSVCAVLQAVAIQWKGFIDPDAFYHAGMGRLIVDQGIISAFPWLDLTVFGKFYSDIHFLFHVYTAPFIWAFGDFQGLRFSGIVLVGLLGFVLSRSLRLLKLPYPFIWVIALFLTQPFVMRMGLGKASPMAMIWFVLGITLFWMNRNIALFFCSFVFALTHNAWVFLLGAVGVLTFGQLLYARIVRAESWRDSFLHSGWKNVFACLLGGIVGTFVHPNAVNDVYISFITIFSIGLGAPTSSLPMGLEWQPLPLSSYIVWFGGWIGLIMLGLSGLLFAPKKNIGHTEGVLLTSFGWLFAVLTAMTLKSVRVVEYLAPVIVFFCASLWACVDSKSFARQFNLVKENGRIAWRGVTFCLLFVGVFLRSFQGVYTNFHESILADDIYATSTRVIAERAKPGERIFHQRWDDFPMLFQANRNVRYVSGLDPYLLFAASNTLSTSYNDLTFGSTTPTREQAWEFIHDDLNTRLIFLSNRGDQQLKSVIEQDSRYTQISSSTDSWVYQIVE